MTALLTALLIGALFLTAALLCIAYVAGDHLPKRPMPFICWTCGCPHTDTTLCCAHCQEVTA